MLSKSSSSSRAIPVRAMLEQVRKEPAMPVRWGKNQAGMQAREDVQDAFTLKSCRAVWIKAAEQACQAAETLAAFGIHKQIANRVLEPFQYTSTIITGTEWDNLFELRCHPDAQPEFQELAFAIRHAMTVSEPKQIQAADSSDTANGWHLPYVTLVERLTHFNNPELLAKVSAARCARVSHLKHDRTMPSVEEDLDLYERLAGSRPLHASPLEHVAFPMAGNLWSGNFKGWFQFRKLIEERMTVTA
jgi:thymidylate synthase ThyX